MFRTLRPAELKCVLCKVISSSLSGWRLFVLVIFGAEALSTGPWVRVIAD
jgi:hypothetical protein